MFPKWRWKYKNCIRNCLFTLVPVFRRAAREIPGFGGVYRRIISPSAGLWSRDTTRSKLKKNVQSVRYSRRCCFVCLSLSCAFCNAICKSPDRWRRQATAHLKFSPRLEEIDYEYKGIATQGGKLKGKRAGGKRNFWFSASETNLS